MLDNVLELRLLLTTLTPKTGAYYWLDVASEDFKRVMIYLTFEEIATHYSFAVLMSRILISALGAMSHFVLELLSKNAPQSVLWWHPKHLLWKRYIPQNSSPQ